MLMNSCRELVGSTEKKSQSVVFSSFKGWYECFKLAEGIAGVIRPDDSRIRIPGSWLQYISFSAGESILFTYRNSSYLPKDAKAPGELSGEVFCD